MRDFTYHVFKNAGEKGEGKQRPPLMTPTVVVRLTIPEQIMMYMKTVTPQRFMAHSAPGRGRVNCVVEEVQGFRGSRFCLRIRQP